MAGTRPSVLIGRGLRDAAALVFICSPVAATTPSGASPRGAGVVLGHFVNCWNPEFGLTRQACCGDTVASCFDDFYTEERCCRDPSAKPETQQCLLNIRTSLLHCVHSTCDDIGREACNEVIESPFCRLHCGSKMPDNNGSSVTRSSELGRALWCLARRNEVRFALDLFLAEGDGSPNLIAHGLASDKLGMRKNTGPKSRASATLMFGFEREPEAFAKAAAWLSAQETVHVTTVSLSDDWYPSELSKFVQRAAAKAEARAPPIRVTALLVKGEPYATSASSSDPRSALRVLCEAVPIDLLFLDPVDSPVHLEFVEAYQFCQPLRWVVVKNANLPATQVGYGTTSLRGLIGQRFWQAPLLMFGLEEFKVL